MSAASVDVIDLDTVHKRPSAAHLVMEEPSEEGQTVVTLTKAVPTSFDSNKLRNYDPNARMIMRRITSLEGSESSYDLFTARENKSGCMLVHAGAPAIAQYMEHAIGVECTYPTHQRCIAREKHVASARKGTRPPWRLDINQFAAEIVATDTPEWRRLKKTVRAFYVQQNAIIQSFMDAESMFDGYRANDHDVTERSSDLWTTRVSNIVNVMLAMAKLVVAVLSGSMAIVSSLIDSAVDLFTGFMLWLASRKNRKHNPYLYPIGRQQLEPLAVTICATVMVAASVQVIFESVRRLVDNSITVDLGVASIVIMCATIVAKFSLYLYCRRVPTPISQALTMDHRNDVISNMGALVFALLAEHFWPPLDPIGAILMSLYIIVGWFQKGKDEAQGLSGRGANANFLKQVTYIARNHHPDIAGIETVTAYHVGTRLVCEVDIVLCPFLSLPDAHDIAETLQMKIESLDDVERCFVHMDYELYHTKSMEHMR